MFLYKKVLPIDEYKKKRNFSITPEPVGHDDALIDVSSELSFVIHKHNASHLHWDLRLEMDGVLKSWALPKGMPMVIKEKRLAVKTEDHPLEYLTFEGVIPEGEYGAGWVEIYDAGTYELVERAEEKIEIYLDGRKHSGRHVIIKFKGDEKNWLLIKLG